MDAQVFGSVAVVQAKVNKEKIHDGKDISGEFVFMDLLEKRAGKWGRAELRRQGKLRNR